MSSAEETGNLNELEALTIGTELYMFPNSATDPNADKQLSQSQRSIPGSQHDASQDTDSQPSHAMQPLANQASPPGTIFADNANNLYMIDPNGYAVPLRSAPPTPVESPPPPGRIPEGIPFSPPMRKKKGFYHAPAALGKNPKVSTLLQYHSDMLQAVRYDRFYACSTTNRYGSSDTMSIHNFSLDTSRGSHGSWKLGTLMDRKSREWMQNERIRREALNNRFGEQGMLGGHSSLLITTPSSERSQEQDSYFDNTTGEGNSSQRHRRPPGSSRSSRNNPSS